jgi:hypothetical protein
MAMQPTWSKWFTNHPSNDAGNLNLKAYSDTLSSGDTEATKLQQVTEEIDTVILAANASNGIIMLHSPKNFGGTRTRPANTLVCMVGMGSQAVSVLADLNSALANCNIIVPTVLELSGCTTAQEVEDIPAPTAVGVIGFEGSSIYIPGLIFRNAIIKSGSISPCKLIPLMNSTARAFEAENLATQVVLNGNPINHADNINAWLYGVQQGTIPETKYLVLPDDVEISNFNANCHLACISRGGVQGGAAQGAVANEDTFHGLVRQLTHGVAAQTEVMAESNNIQEKFFEHQDSREEAKKDRTKKIHLGIIKMIGRAAATRGDDSLVLPATCL